MSDEYKIVEKYGLDYFKTINNKRYSIKIKGSKIDLDPMFIDDDFISCHSKISQAIADFELVDQGVAELKDKMFSRDNSFSDVKNWVTSVNEKLLTPKGILLKQAIQRIEQGLK